MTIGISKFSIDAIEEDLLEFREAKEALHSVVSEYTRCVREKDTNGFLYLFYQDDTPWLGKFDAASEEKARESNPDITNNSGLFDISKKAFINSMVNPPAAIRCEEHISNLDIETDGLIASLSFDYKMLVNDQIIRGGREFWQLIKTNQGWKIVSVIYSIKF